MTTSDIILMLAIFAFVMLTQVGRRAFDRRRIILTLAVVGGVGGGYLRKLPPGEHNLTMALLLGLLGVVFGLLALAFVHIERDAQGRRFTRAGATYVVIWAIAMGGRLLFGYGAQHWYTTSLGRWMASHQLSPRVWAAGFALMAITMVAVRTLGLMARFALHPADAQTTASEPVAVPREYGHHPVA